MFAIIASLLVAAVVLYFMFRRIRSATAQPSSAVAPVNQPPSARILTPAGGPQNSPVAVSYSLADPESDRAAISVKFSTDGGQTWSPATEATTGSDGVKDLPTTPTGITHKFAWDAAKDLSASASGVVIELTPSDTRPGVAVRSVPFDVLLPASVPTTGGSATIPTAGGTTAPMTGGVATTIPGPVATTTAQPPEVHIFAPTDNVGPVVPVVFLLSDPLSQPVDIEVTYDTGQGPQTATPALGSVPVTRLPAPEITTDYRFLWDAGHDIGLSQQKTATISITPIRSGVRGIQQQATIAVDTTPADPLPTNQLTSVIAQTLEIVSGNDQKCIAGQLLAEPLKVRVRDDKSQPLPGARVSFSVSANSAVKGAIEEEPTYATTSDADGVVAVRVRPEKGTTGKIEVIARVAGMPQSAQNTQTFSADVRAPKIIPDKNYNPGGPLQYGQIYNFYYYYDGDDDPTTIDFTPDPARPVRWKIEATNAELQWPQVAFVFPGGQSNLAILPLIPSTLDQDIVLTITDMDDPTVKRSDTIKVKTDPNNRRIRELQPNYVTDPVLFRLALDQGADPTRGGPQVAYPGLELATAYRVKLLDDPGNEYTRMLTSGQSGCVTVSPVDLKVTWASSGGMFATSTAASATLSASLTELITTPVYFKPSGAGPWWIDVSVDADVYDKYAKTFQWTDSSGQQHCERENSLHVNISRNIFVQLPAFEVQDATTQTRITDPVPAGATLQINAVGLSPFVSGGTPEDAELKGLRADLSDAPSFTGDVYPFEQSIGMDATAPATLVSKKFLVVRGYPQLSTTGGVVQSVFPRSWLRFTAAGLAQLVRTDGREWRRRQVDGVASIQETVAGTTPYDGFDGSIQLAGGEMLRSVTDLTFRTRGGDVMFARTYRDHLAGSGMFGPGWVALHESSADISRPWGVALLDGYGRLFDFVNWRLPESQYVVFNQYTALDKDHGSVEIQDRFGTKAHYNIDGSLKFLEDLNQNRTTFTYNSNAQLTEVKDPLGRVTKLEYFPDTATPKEVRGRLRKITDFDSREVEYEYYTADGSDGKKGWLKKCSRPDAETMINGARKAGYRRGEMYTYVVSADPLLDGSLKEVLDNEQQRVVLTEYTTRRQVEKQTYGGGALVVKYNPAPPRRETEVTDRAGNKRTWTFKDSPYPDAATPVKVVEKANGVRPGAPDSTTTMEHNIHGELTSVTFPGGIAQKYVYDDKSPYSRSLGNLLSFEEVPASGPGRYVTWGYNLQFNLVSGYVHWDGYRLRLHKYLRTHYTYDANGNLTDIIQPRAVYGTMIKNSLGHDEIRWVHESNHVHIEYNAKGLPKSVEDPTGVVTRYEYYPEATPEGAAGMATGPDAGGFLGAIIRDAQTTSNRDLYFPGAPLANLKSTVTYDRRGDIASSTDERGVTTGYTCNKLRQVTTIVHNQSVPAGTAGAPSAMTEFLRYDINGMLVQREVAQGQAAAATTLQSSDVTRDAEGRALGIRSDWERGAVSSDLSQQVKYNGEGLIEEVYAPTAAAPGAPSPAPGPELVKVVRDERGLPFQHVLSPGADPLTYQIDFTPGGDPKKISGPADEWISAEHDPFGAVSSITDFGENELFALPDEEDQYTRIGLRSGSGTASRILGFQELYKNEVGQVRRVHNSLIDVDTTASGPGTYQFPLATEGYPDPQPGANWPPLKSSNLEDKGKWSPGDGRVSTETLRDPLGRLARFANDENRMHCLSRRPSGGCNTAFDNGSYVVRHTPDAYGDTETIELEELSTDPMRPNSRKLVWKTQRDALGRPIAVIDALGNVIRSEYDDFGDIQAVTDPIGPDSTNPQDTINGHVFNTTGNRTHYVRDRLGRIRRMYTDLTKDGLGGNPIQTSGYNLQGVAARGFDYDAAGRLTTIIDTEGNQTVFGYEDKQGGRCVSLTHQGQPQAQYKYDDKGRLESWTDPQQTKVKLEYDGKNRVAKIHVENPGAGVIGVDGYTFTYDGMDHLETATEINRGYVTEFRWDFLGNLRKETQRGDLVHCEYNGTGQRTMLRYPSGGPQVDAIIDSNGRLRRLQQPPAAAGGTPDVLAIYEYIGRRSLLNRATGPVHLQFDYDDAGRLKRQWLSPGDIEFITEPRRDGRFRKWTRKTGSITETREWRYDSAGRIVHEDAVFAPGRSPDTRSVDRFFDGDGVLRREERVEKTAGASQSILVENDRGEGGRIVKHNQVLPLTYDNNGNVTRYGRFGYFYDFLDRLVKVKDFNSADETYYDYDALGRCTARSRGGVSERYIYDGWHLIEVRVKQGGQEKVTERYYYGRAVNELIRAEINGGLRYFVPAPDGSVDSLLDANGNVIESYDYTLGGKVTVLDAQRKPTGTAPQCRFTFHGHMYDPGTQLLYMRHRYYNTDLEQFLTPDPVNIIRSTNLYGFAGNDAVNMTDYFGFEETGIDWREAPLEFAKPVGLVLVVALGMGIVSVLFPWTIPFMVPLGAALLAGTAVYNAGNRADAGQTFFESMSGGVMDTLGVTSLAHGFLQADPATGAFMPLTPQQRGRAIGGGFGMLVTFFMGGRAFRGGRAVGGRIKRAWAVEQPWTEGSVVLRANRSSGRQYSFTRNAYRDDMGTETVTSNGRPETFEDFVDAIQARLESMPRPGTRANFRETSITRLRSYDAAGNPRSSDLVLQTRHGGGLADQIPAEVEQPLFDRMQELLARYPRLRVSGRMHTHPPLGNQFREPGHSWGDYNVFHDRFMAPQMNGRLAPGLRPMVVCISETGAPAEVAYINLPLPRVPRASTSAPPFPWGRITPPRFIAPPLHKDER